MLISRNDVQLYVEQRGAGSPTLVFLHYWGGSMRTWRHVIEALASQSRTVAIDLRGWGRSGASASGYALNELADDVEAVIKSLDLERYIIVGHSMGGKIGQLMASRRPNGLVGLVLVAPAPPTALDLPLAARQAMVGAYESRESIVATVEHVLAPDGLDADDLETVIADSLAGAAAAKEAWPLSTSQQDIGADVANIDVPVLVISGAHDRVDPPEVLRRELLARIPQAELCVLPNVGHLLPLEAPDAIAELIRAFTLARTKDGFSMRSAQRDATSPPCPTCAAAQLAAAKNRSST